MLSYVYWHHPNSRNDLTFVFNLLWALAVFVFWVRYAWFVGFPGGSGVRNLPAKQEIWVWSLGQEHPLEKEMDRIFPLGVFISSSILAWEIPWTEELGRLQSIRLHKRTLSSVQFSHSVMSSSLQPHESQHARPPCPSPTPGVYPNSCPSSRWCHPAISSSVMPFSSCPQSLPASGSFPMRQLFAWDGQSIGVSPSASVLPMNTQDWSPLGWTGWISLQSKGLSRVFSNITDQKHQFVGAQL